MGKQWKHCIADSDCSHEIKGCLFLGRKAMKNLDSLMQRQHFSDKGLSSQSYGFSSSHAQMWQLNHKEGWVLKNWCFWAMVLEKTLESPLDSKEIKPVNPKGNYHEYSLEGLMLKLQYFGHLMRRAGSWKWPWYWERFRAGGEGGNRGWDGWMASPAWWTWVWVSSRRC